MPPCVIVSLESLMKARRHRVRRFGVARRHARPAHGPFAATTEDRQWIHMDPGTQPARNAPYRTTIAHGFLTLSLISHFMKQAVEVRGIRMAINYGLNRVRGFRGPFCAAHAFAGASP